MAPKKQAIASGAALKTDMGRSDSTSIDASQELDMTRVQDLMNNHNQRAKERRRERKGEIVSAHKARIEKFDGDVRQCLKNHDGKVRAIRRPQVERLIELVRKKRALQDRFDKCQHDLEQVFLSTARQLQIALDGRVEELSA